MPISMWDVQSAPDGMERSVRAIAASTASGTADQHGMHAAMRWAAPPTMVTPTEELLASADGLCYPRARFEIKIERRCEWYLWNVVLVTWALVSISAVVYAMPVADTSDRMSLNVTLVLTVIAFKFTFGSDIPKKAYLTWMDKYLIVAFLILALQSAEICLASQLAEGSRALAALEMGFCAVVYGLWTLYHLFVAAFSHRLYLPWAQVIGSQRVQIVL